MRHVARSYAPCAHLPLRLRERLPRPILRRIPGCSAPVRRSHTPTRYFSVSVSLIWDGCCGTWRRAFRFALTNDSPGIWAYRMIDFSNSSISRGELSFGGATKVDSHLRNPIAFCAPLVSLVRRYRYLMGITRRHLNGWKSRSWHLVAQFPSTLLGRRSELARLKTSRIAWNTAYFHSDYNVAHYEIQACGRCIRR